MKKLRIGVVVAIGIAVAIGFVNLWFAEAVPEISIPEVPAISAPDEETDLDLFVTDDLVAADHPIGDPGEREVEPSASETAAVAEDEVPKGAKDAASSAAKPLSNYAAYEEEFEKQAIDPAWSPQTAAMIESLISSSGAVYDSMTVDCRTTICRVEVMHTFGQEGLDAAETAKKISTSMEYAVAQSQRRLDTIGGGTQMEPRPAGHEQQPVTRIWLTGREFRARQRQQTLPQFPTGGSQGK